MTKLGVSDITLNLTVNFELNNKSRAISYNSADMIT